MYRRLLLLVPTTLLFSDSASAHLVSTRFGEFYAGLLHPLTTLVHLIPWIALALLAAIQGRFTARHTLWVFPGAVALGALAGALLPVRVDTLAANIASIVALGALVALARPLPLKVFLLVAMLFGLSHGYANAVTGLGAWSQFLYCVGVATAAYLIVTLVGASSLVVTQIGWGLIAVRALGSWILASGLIFAGFSLSGGGIA